MKRYIFTAVVFMSIFFAQSAGATIVSYSLTDLGSDSFEYVYIIENDSLQVAIEQFTIWFDEQLYDNLQVTTQSPLSDGWDEVILPSSGFGIPLGYDADTLGSGVGSGLSVEGFSVSFDWLGTGQPSYQPFEIINPSDSQTIDSGNTVPEPTMILLFGLGSMFLKNFRFTKALCKA